MSADDGRALAERLRREAERLGFSGVGITTPDPSTHMDAYRRWLEAGHHGEMGYLARPDAVARRGDLSRTLEGVRSVVVLAEAYPHEDPPGVPDDPSVGVIARYARGRDYHAVVATKLRTLVRVLPDGVATRGYVDTGPILERDLARRAGLGWQAKNTMLIDPGKGSWFFLAVLLLDVELPVDAPFETDRCGTCRACLDACPTGALLGRDENGAPVMDARRCISYLTIEHRGPIPEELRPLMGNRVFGCDICQEVCPWNERFAAESMEAGYAARGPGERPVGVEALPAEDVSAETHPGTRAPSLVALMRMTREEWDAFSRGSAIRRAGYAGFKRNVAVAMGNWLAALEGDPSEDEVAALREALEGGSELVQEHAAWALGRAKT
ncbi:MAG: tRNA epoxyqueuosine(34) reductase QueG [Longimicrobiales bacterium]